MGRFDTRWIARSFSCGIQSLRVSIYIYIRLVYACKDSRCACTHRIQSHMCMCVYVRVCVCMYVCVCVCVRESVFTYREWRRIRGKAERDNPWFVRHIRPRYPPPNRLALCVYGVTSISRLLKTIGLFCRISSLS